jgi:hypothetical protein
VKREVGANARTQKETRGAFRLTQLLTQLLSPNSVKRGAVGAECDRLQSGKPLAAAGAADEDRDLVADQFATAVGEDRRTAGQTRPLLMAVAGGEPPDAATLWGHRQVDGFAALARGIEFAAGRRKYGESGRGDGEVSEQSHGKRVKVPVDAKPKAPIWPPDVVVVPGVQNCIRERACRVYNTVARDTKMEIPVRIKSKGVAPCQRSRFNALYLFSWPFS